MAKNFDLTQTGPEVQANLDAVGTNDQRAQEAEQDLQQQVDNIDERLKTVEELAEISVGGGDIQIATAADFESNEPSSRAKVPTVGAIKDYTDAVPTAESEKLVKSGGVQNELALGTVYDVSAKNPTSGPNNDSKWESLSTLLSDANLDTLIPTAYRKGGMSIKFIQSSDNKYVQFRLMTNSWSSNDANWEKYNDVTTSNRSHSDLDVADDQGNVLAQFKNGHIKTKNFDSSKNALSEADVAKVATIEAGAEVNDVVTDDTTDADLTLSDENDNVLAIFKDGHIKTKNFDSGITYNTDRVNSGLFDYETALLMQKNTLKCMVECASNGRCTVIHDADGYPSLMYRVPIVSVGALAPELGNIGLNAAIDTPHPAFVVNGTEVPEIYFSVYKTCEYDGHLVSWYGLPSKGLINLEQLRNRIGSKGNGWHLETVYEHSLLALLTKAYNSPNPRGNTCKGYSRHEGFAHEYVKMNNGKLPGLTNQAGSTTGPKWINGTQPPSWSHNGELWGIQDVCGGYYEMYDLVKIVGGQIYLASDNNFVGEEVNWGATGAYIDFLNDKLTFNTSFSVTGEDLYLRHSSNWEDVATAPAYDNIDINMRKKLCLLLLTPRVSSSEASAITLGINGYTTYQPVNNTNAKVPESIDNWPITHYIMGGSAEDYAPEHQGGFGAAYNWITEPVAHGNVGSRMCYIKL